jgi:hypothetical protein
MAEIEYFEHIISAKGIQLRADRMTAIKDKP